jgi:hypothetical protein
MTVVVTGVMGSAALIADPPPPPPPQADKATAAAAASARVNRGIEGFMVMLLARMNGLVESFQLASLRTVAPSCRTPK